MSDQAPAADDARIDVSALLAAVIRALPRIVLVTLALLVATFVVLMFQPRLYESSAAILVEPRTNAYVRPSNDQGPIAAGNAAGVVSSQIELLKSRDTLLNVIDQLDLRSVPEFNGGQGGFSPLGMIAQMIGRRAATPTSVDETVLNTLYDRLTVVQERDSAIISVLVRSTDPQLAADIANAVANAHVARRAQLSISDTAEASGWLRDEINRLRSSVQQAESAVADFKVSNDLFTGQNNTSLLDQQLSTIATQITTAQERKNTALSRAALIRDLIGRGQSIEGVADVRNSLVIQQLSQEKARLQGELAQRSVTLLSSHPTILALNAQVGELDNQIRQEGRRVAAALEAEAQIEADLELSLQADLDRAKASASTATRDTVTLDGLQREAAAQRSLLEAYLLRYNDASSRVDGNSALPDVRVVSVAAPAVSPASPKTSLVMIAVGLVSFAIQVGAIAFSELMSGRALVPVNPGVPAPQRQRPVRQDELDAVPFDEAELEPDQRYEEPEPEPVPEPTAELEPELEVDPELEPMAVAESAAEPVLVTPAQAVFPEPPLDEPAIIETPVIVDLEPVSEDAGVLLRALGAKPEPQETERAAEPEDEDEEKTIIFPPFEAMAEESFNAPFETMADEPFETDAEIEAEPPQHFPVGITRYSDLVSDLVLGRTHLLLLADCGPAQAAADLAEELVGDALAKGLSVALIDAGTGRHSDNPGLTDLSTGAASFGDVVQKSADNSFAEVTWGQGEILDRSSSRPVTLAEALGDIYEVVVVLTGRVDRKSMLGAFAELGGRVVLVAGDEEQAGGAEDLRRRLEEAGLPRVEITALAELVAA